jgi:hypothetical protein
MPPFEIDKTVQDLAKEMVWGEGGWLGQS